MNSTNSSESDSDVPLSTLINRSKDKRDINNSSATSSSRKKSQISKKSAKRKKISDAESSSDDDIPLIQLRKELKGLKTSNIYQSRQRKKVAEKKNEWQDYDDTDDECSDSSEKPSVVTRSSVLNGTTKGDLIMKLLCRWWFAMDYPTEEDLDPNIPPGYMELDGHRGVYVCVTGSSIGKLFDARNKKNCPSFDVFSRKTCGELMQLLRTALEEQRLQLKKHWSVKTEVDGGAVWLMKAASNEDDLITEELKWLSQISSRTGEAEAVKLLKEANFDT